MLFKQLAEEKAQSGPSKSTRSQTSAVTAKTIETSNSSKKSGTGRLNTPSHPGKTSSFPVNVSDGLESMTANGLPDYGSDETIVSSKFAENAVIHGIGKMKKDEPIVLQVPLKEGDATQSFTFSRTCTPTRIILRLAAGPLAIVNVTFLVADAALAAEDLLLGLPILQHLGVDTKTLLEQKRDVLDGYDCSYIGRDPTVSKGGHISHLMTVRFSRSICDSDSTAVENVLLMSTTIKFGMKKIHSRIHPCSTLWTPDSTTKLQTKATVWLKRRSQMAFRTKISRCFVVSSTSI